MVFSVQPHKERKIDVSHLPYSFVLTPPSHCIPCFLIFGTPDPRTIVGKILAKLRLAVVSTFIVFAIGVWGKMHATEANVSAKLAVGALFSSVLVAFLFLLYLLRFHHLSIPFTVHTSRFSPPIPFSSFITQRRRLIEICVLRIAFYRTALVSGFCLSYRGKLSHTPTAPSFRT